MIVKGTKKIRGVLQLPNAKKELSFGRTAHITENEYQSQDIQTALSLGLIEVIDNRPTNMETMLDNNISSDSVRQFICVNNSQRSITLPNRTGSIQPNHKFTLSELEINSSDIKEAIGVEIIKIVKQIGISGESSEGKISLIEKLESESTESTDVESDARKFIIDASKSNQINELETNEEISELKTIDEDNPAPIEPKDIPDPKQHTIIYDPKKMSFFNKK